jgi:thymidylate synthase (FAD)
MLESTDKQTVSRQPQINSVDPLADGISSIELVRVSGSDVDVVNAARVSFGKFVTEVSTRDVALIKFLMKHRHTSPFEHNQLSFRIKCPLFVARQWMRHRMNSYNEISYRYVNAPLEFYIPPKWRVQDTINKQASIGAVDNPHATQRYTHALTVASEIYQELLDMGIGRELARAVLPTATYTQFIFTCNLHSLMHFLKLRLDAGAQFEIRQYAQGMLKLALPHFPISLQAWKECHAPDINLENDLFTTNFTNAL